MALSGLLVMLMRAACSTPTRMVRRVTGGDLCWTQHVISSTGKISGARPSTDKYEATLYSLSAESAKKSRVAVGINNLDGQAVGSNGVP